MIETLLSDYRASAIVHGNATIECNARKTNRAYGRLHETLNKISNSNDDNALLDLFNDTEVWVQLWAAAHSLEIDADNAIAKLKSLADAEVPLISMSARYTIHDQRIGKRQSVVQRLNNFTKGLLCKRCGINITFVLPYLVGKAQLKLQ